MIRCYLSHLKTHTLYLLKQKHRDRLKLEFPHFCEVILIWPEM